MGRVSDLFEADGPYPGDRHCGSPSHLGVFDFDFADLCGVADAFARFATMGAGGGQSSSAESVRVVAGRCDFDRGELAGVRGSD